MCENGIDIFASGLAVGFVAGGMLAVFAILGALSHIARQSRHQRLIAVGQEVRNG